jgi:hypothetical protein
MFTLRSEESHIFKKLRMTEERGFALRLCGGLATPVKIDLGKPSHRFNPENVPLLLLYCLLGGMMAQMKLKKSVLL